MIDCQVCILVAQGFRNARKHPEQAHVEEPRPVGREFTCAMGLQAFDRPDRLQPEHAAIGYPPFAGKRGHAQTALHAIAQTFNLCIDPMRLASVDGCQKDVGIGHDNLGALIEKKAEFLDIGRRKDIVVKREQDIVRVRLPEQEIAISDITESGCLPDDA